MISDIAMITPVRDGMNLVAKEFIATRVDSDGVLILSEMAGASKELFEAIIVNPFDLDTMADSILKAIKMPIDEQVRRNQTMQNRLSRYTVRYWANAFFKTLKNKSSEKKEPSTIKIKNGLIKTIQDKFSKATKRLLVFDYDGTLVDFHHKPEAATPSDEVLSILKSLAEKDRTRLVIISGRDKQFLDKWFSKLNITLFAVHGHFYKKVNKKWVEKIQKDNNWKQNFLPIFQDFTDRTPGTFIEEKSNCVVSVSYTHLTLPTKA